MADDDDVAKALAFLHKHDSSKTGAPMVQPQDLELAGIDFEDPDSFSSLVPLKKQGQIYDHEPVGPNWKRPGSSVQLPTILGHPPDAWLIHERQEANGKYKAWLFFNAATGKYYGLNDAGKGYLPLGVPHDPWDFHMSVRVGNASVLSGPGVKLDLCVLLPDLPKTGFLLRQPLEFLDKPASLFVLCAGLRNSGAASEFCAKRLHSKLLPKLSSKPTVWFDHDLTDLVTNTVKELDTLLLESPACNAGCSLAVAVLVGKRLVVGSLGSTRCVICRPPLKATPVKAGASGANQDASLAPWTAKLVGGGEAHLLTNKDEKYRIESEGGHIVGDSEAKLYAGSARPAALAACTDDWEREMLRVTRGMNSFAVLGITVAELEEGSAAVRKVFRRRSLAVHPDKIKEIDRRKRTTEMFSKLEAAAGAIEAMLSENRSSTFLLARVHAAQDEGRLAADPAVASKLLGVEQGCGEKLAKAAVDKKFHPEFAKLQNVGRNDVERGMKILETAVSTVVRGTQLWVPPEAHEGVRVSRALGCKDLKVPVRLLTAQVHTEVVQLTVGEPVGLALMAEGAELVTNPTISRRLAEHFPSRPKAAALRIALDAKQAAWDRGERPRDAISVVCAFVKGEAPPTGSAAWNALPAAKRAKVAKPDRVRVSHVLLRWADLKLEDGFERPNMPQPTRSQADAERELLELMETLLEKKEPKTLGARFKAEVLKRSECSTALNVPHADLGWIETGGAEASLEVAGFDMAIGGLSDVVITSRGAHLMYRLA